MLEPTTTRIRTNQYERNYRRTIEKLEFRKDVSSRNTYLIKNFCKDCLEGRTVVNRKKKKVGLGAVMKYLFGLIVMARHMKKDFDKLPADDKDNPTIRSFVAGLDNGKILNKSAKPYTEKTRADIKKTLRKFYKWLYGENITYPRLVQYVDTSHEEAEIPALTREEVFFWANREKTLRKRAILFFLFDSGARAEEFLNIRMKNVRYDEKERSYRVRIEFSKTKPRTIYVPMATESMRQYIDSYEEKHNPEARLFPIRYNTLLKHITTHSQKHLKKRVTPHILRHSSATYYCTKLNPYQLCYRYGWSMSSDMPQRYIDREGLVDLETTKAVRIDRDEAIVEENRKLKEELFLQRQAVGDLEKKFTEFEEFKKSMELISLQKRASKVQG